ncbi:MAG: hypothetical protein CR972_05170 [Candidatus Moraniibacteriota bacterium]|nr:MAG: hypothetical protein CR972_05170 [Candidatus Moranbacteria bacterium]
MEENYDTVCFGFFSVVVLGVVGIVITVIAGFKICPSNKVLIKYNCNSGNKSVLSIHDSVTFVWPFFQSYGFLDLEPITTDINLKNVLSKQNIMVNVASRFAFGIGTTPELLQAAAEHLFGIFSYKIEEKARNAIITQISKTIATMDIEEINADRNTFEQRVVQNIETEFQKIGLKLINADIGDITDESGYFEAEKKIEEAHADRNRAAQKNGAILHLVKTKTKKKYATG